MDAFVVTMFDQAVIGAFDDGETEVERIAHRVEPLALGHGSVHRRLVEGEERRIAPVELNDREIVRHVHPDQAEIAVAAVSAPVFEPVSLRLQCGLRDHMIVRDRKPVGGDEEAGADRCLPSGICKQRTDLQ